MRNNYIRKAGLRASYLGPLVFILRTVVGSPAFAVSPTRGVVSCFCLPDFRSGSFFRPRHLGATCHSAVVIAHERTNKRPSDGYAGVYCASFENIPIRLWQSLPWFRQSSQSEGSGLANG